MVSADFVAQGRIGRFNKDLTINVELYNVKSGVLMDSFTGHSKDIYGFLALLDEKAPIMFKNMLATAPPPTPPPPPQQPIAAEAPVAAQIVDEPYTPPFVPAGDTAESDSGEEKAKRKLLTFGVMAGINLSHITFREKSYGDAVGVQLGAVADFAPFNWLRIQPGIMYIQKGLKDKGGSITAHYIELPLLLSLKLSAFRLNAGPYFGYCLGSGYDYVFDSTEYGVSAGIGFDIGRYYIGMFYDYGIANGTNNFNLINNTLGFNFGMNL